MPTPPPSRHLPGEVQRRPVGRRSRTLPRRRPTRRPARTRAAPARRSTTELADDLRRGAPRRNRSGSGLEITAQVAANSVLGTSRRVDTRICVVPPEWTRGRHLSRVETRTADPTHQTRQHQKRGRSDGDGPCLPTSRRTADDMEQSRLLQPRHNLLHNQQPGPLGQGRILSNRDLTSMWIESEYGEVGDEMERSARGIGDRASRIFHRRRRPQRHGGPVSDEVVLGYLGEFS